MGGPDEGGAARVAVMTSDFLPMQGGIARMLDGLLASCVGAVNFHVYTTVPGKESDDTLLPYAITRLEMRRPGERPGDGVLFLRKMNSLVAHIRAPRRARSTIQDSQATFRPDVVLFGCWDHAASYWAAACRRRRLPYVFLAHGMEITSRRGLVMRYRRMFDLRRAGAVIANSNATASAVRSAGVDPRLVVVINPGVDEALPVRLTPEEQISVRRAIGVNDNPYILSAGRFIRRKGFDLVIGAFCALAPEFPRLHLVVAGDGPERDNLEALARGMEHGERIHFPGYVVGRMRASLFQGCEFFVLGNREVPGEIEGFGLVFREAGQFGKASIGGNNGGVSEAVRAGTTGILVDISSDSGPLVEAIRLLLASPERSRALGQGALEFVTERGTWGCVAGQYRTVFTGLAKVRTAAPEEDIMHLRR